MVPTFAEPLGVESCVRRGHPRTQDSLFRPRHKHRPLGFVRGGAGTCFAGFGVPSIANPRSAESRPERAHHSFIPAGTPLALAVCTTPTERSVARFRSQNIRTGPLDAY